MVIKGQDVNQLLEWVVVFIVGREIGAQNVVGLVILTLINTILWLILRKEFGTTVGRILKKQCLELFATFGILFALKMVFSLTHIENAALITFWAFLARQIFFILIIGKRAFSNHDLDKGNKVTNMIFGKIFRVVRESFNLDNKDADYDDSLFNDNQLYHDKRHTQNLNIDDDIRKRPDKVAHGKSHDNSKECDESSDFWTENE